MRHDPTRLIRLAIWCAGLVFISPAPAEEIGGPRVRASPDGTVLEISGPLLGNVGAQVQGALSTSPRVRMVRLDSEGGVIAVGLEVQTAIKQRGLNTDVRGICSSACTIAFLGGVRRSAAQDARLGFHGAGGDDGATLAAQLIVRGLYLHAGLAEGFVDRALATPHDEMWYPSAAELRDAGVLTAGTTGQ